MKHYVSRFETVGVAVFILAGRNRR